MSKIFILSPARLDGKRAGLILNRKAHSNLAKRLREDGAPLAEVFSFVSGLYFRGKYAYGSHYGVAPPGLEKCYVITSNSGLVDAKTQVTLKNLRSYLKTKIDPEVRAYSKPLIKSAEVLSKGLKSNTQVILLGSIATAKYYKLLLEAFDKQLYFPTQFIGRGDMSRGGLLLSSLRSGTELQYSPCAKLLAS